MPLFDYFRGFFGFSQKPPNYGFYANRECDDCEAEEEEEEEEGGDGAHGFENGGPFGQFGGNPFEKHFEEMFRHFEEMFAQIGMAELPPLPPHFHEEFGAMDQPRGAERRSLRDEALRASERPGLGLAPFSPREGDVDLDARISKEGLDRLLPKEDESRLVRPSAPQPHMRFQRVTISKIRKPDGSIEERRTVMDSEGNEETVVTRAVDDRTHSLTTRRSKEGETASTKEFVNVSQDELSSFTKRWQRGGDAKHLDGDSASFFGRLFKDWSPK